METAVNRAPGPRAPVDPAVPGDAEPLVGLRGYRVADPERSAQRRAAVIEAAARVFADKDYHAATMDDIAHEMGVSKGVLYYQFRSKEEVFTEIMVTAISEALRLLAETISHGGTPAERLRDGIRQLIAWNLEETSSGYYSKTITADLRILSPSNRDTVRTLQRAYQRVIVDLIEEGVAAGVFDVPSPSVAAMNILYAANGVSRWFVRGRPVSAAQVADAVSDQLVRGILAGVKSG